MKTFVIVAGIAVAAAAAAVAIYRRQEIEAFASEEYHHLQARVHELEKHLHHAKES